LTVSDTATAFNPPNIAYILPIIPISQTDKTIALSCEIPNIPGISKSFIIAIEPEYSTVGKNAIPKVNKKNILTIFLTDLSYLSSKNSGTVVIEPCKYLGKKYIAKITIPIDAPDSQAITASPLLNPCALSPTICSVDRFVNIIEPAITVALKLLPPKK